MKKYAFIIAVIMMTAAGPGGATDYSTAPVVQFLPVADKSYEKVKAVGRIEAPPEIVWEVLTDHSVIYSKNVADQKVLKKQQNSTWLFVNNCIKWLDFSYVLKITQVCKYKHLTWDQDAGNEVQALLKKHNLATTDDFDINKGEWFLAPSPEGGTELTYIPSLALANPVFNLLRGYAISKSIPDLYGEIQTRAKALMKKRNMKFSAILKPSQK